MYSTGHQFTARAVYSVNTMVGVIAGLVAAAMRKGSTRRVFQDHDLDNNNNLPQQRSRSKH